MVEKKCNDRAFGEMNYKHRWYKQQSIIIFEKSWDMTIVARAYSGKAITEEQRKSYSLFMQNETHFIDIISNELKKYVNFNLEEIASFWADARQINDVNELSQIVTPKTLLFKQDGATIMLFDCIWDIENGLGVEVLPNVLVGVQDLFL